MLLCSAQKLTAQTYGLKFQGQDVTLDKRTELNLTPENYLKFKDEFEVSFDIKMDLMKRNSLFGYVLRVISEDNYNVDLISTPEPNHPLNLVVGKNNTIVSVKRFENTVNQWINLRLKFILSEDKVVFYITDTFYVQSDVGLKKEDAFKIIFGANDYKQFKTTDVPSMNIRNVKLIENGNLKYHWPLELSEGNIAIDRIKKIPASVKNPIWLMNDHESWQLKSETEVQGTLLFAIDEEHERIFMVGSNELSIYSAENNNVEKIQYINKPNFIANNCNAFYNSTDNKIYCYLVEKIPVYALDIATGEWSETGNPSDVETKYKHHNQYYSPSDNSLYLWGGYGFHKYNNEIFKLDLNENSWTVLNTNDSVFLPRYLAGLGILNDTAYIFGGYGSESGNQLINPQSYYDLVGYSLKDGELFKKFEVPRIIDDMAVANSMWIDKQNRDFYALIFEKTKFDGYLQLIKGNLNASDIEMLGNKIPFKFLDIKSSAGLYYMPRQKKLFAYTTYSSDSITTQSQIYSISYPPNVFEAETEVAKHKSPAYWKIVILFMLAALVIFVAYYSRKRKKKSEVLIANTQEIEIVPEAIEVSTAPALVPDEIKYQLILFGGFQAFNKDFVDITNKFSPLLKELFLLIWLYTFKNDKGISSSKITEILWFDKSEKSSRNNRAVNIAKLRGIMEEEGICALSKNTGYWKIICEESNFKSDYIDFLRLTSSKTNLTKQKIQHLIDITGKGAFLHNVSYEWLDEFKSRTSDTIIDTFVEFGKACDIKNEPEFIIHLSDAIFNFDFVNEDAMMMKCKAEYCMGKHSLAKSTYEKFCKEYLTMYDQEYEKSFLKILNI